MKKMKKIREKKSYKNEGNYDVGRFGEYLGWLFIVQEIKDSCSLLFIGFYLAILIFLASLTYA